MINHLNGTVRERGSDFVVIECAGIGFRVAVTASTLKNLPQGDNPITIMTHLQLRDGGGDLFGFSSEDEREIFHALVGVAGVGPKSGMAVLSVLGENGVISGSLRGDAKLFSSVPGIGKKLAQRMVSELPDRLKKISQTGDDYRGHINAVSGTSPKGTDAVEALVSLGFSRLDAYNAVVNISKVLPENPETEQLIKEGLAHLYANSRPASR